MQSYSSYAFHFHTWITFLIVHFIVFLPFANEIMHYTPSDIFASKEIQNSAIAILTTRIRPYKTNKTGSGSMDEHAAATVKLSSACHTGTMLLNRLAVTMAVVDWRSHNLLEQTLGNRPCHHSSRGAEQQKLTVVCFQRCKSRIKVSYLFWFRLYYMLLNTVSQNVLNLVLQCRQIVSRKPTVIVHYILEYTNWGYNRWTKYLKYVQVQYLLLYTTVSHKGSVDWSPLVFIQERVWRPIMHDEAIAVGATGGAAGPPHWQHVRSKSRKPCRCLHPLRTTTMHRGVCGAMTPAPAGYFQTRSKTCLTVETSPWTTSLRSKR